MPIGPESQHPHHAGEDYKCWVGLETLHVRVYSARYLIFL